MIILDSEIIISGSALRHLQVSGNRKQKVEMHIDLSQLLNSANGQSNSSIGVDVPNNILRQIFPDP